MVSRVMGITAAVTVLALGLLGAGRAGAQGAPALDSLVPAIRQGMPSSSGSTTRGCITRRQRRSRRC